MNDLLNQLVGLCAGREALLRLKRRQLLGKFKDFQDDLEYKDERSRDCQLFTDIFNVTANHSNNRERRSFLKPWEQPNHGITFRYKPQVPQPNENAEVFHSCELFRIRPIPIQLRNQDARRLQNFTIPPTSSGEHTTSFASIMMSAPSVLFRSNLYKISRSHQSSAKRARRSNGDELLNPSQTGNRLSPAITDSHRFYTPAIMRHSDTGADLLRNSTTFVFLDKFEADMRTLTDDLIKQQVYKREVILPRPEKRQRVRVELDATSASPEELEQARESTTFRGDPGLQHQFPEAGKVDVYKKNRGRRPMTTRSFFGWVRR